MSGNGISGVRRSPRPARQLDSGSPELLADPFQEHAAPLMRGPLQLLGARFRFESNSEELLAIVDSAYAGLPGHTLSDSAPELCVRLLVSDRGRTHRVGSEPPPLEMFSGGSLLGGATASSDFVVISPHEGTALMRVSPRMLAYPYHTRYELIEFAVFTLAARCQGLVPLHSACMGLGGRGVLLMGPSGAGKSTVALQCLLQGFDFISEDSAFVTPDTLLATGVANFLHVRADSMRFVAHASEVEAIRSSPLIRRRSGVRKLEVDLRCGSYRLAAEPLRIAAIVFASPQLATGPLLAPLEGPAIATRLAAEQAYAASQPQWSLFCQSVRGIKGFELRRGRHPMEAVEALRTLLGAWDIRQGEP